MKLHILGCFAATPRTLSNPTSQVLEINNHLFLIDCGEGTQVQLRKHKIKFSRISHIFISHLHGDHFFGLPGLISTFRLLGREKELHIYGPKGIKEAMTLMLKLGNSWTNYPLIFHELSKKSTERIFEDERVEVDTLPLDHRIYTNGFLFREKTGLRKLNIEAVQKYGIDKAYYSKIKQGEDMILDDGQRLENALLTFDPAEPWSYGYCSDTAYDPGLAPALKGIKVLYHEATFLESELRLAGVTKHATAKQAASIARDAGVDHLILGHFSTRYKDLSAFAEEAGTIFPDVLLAEDGKCFEF